MSATPAAHPITPAPAAEKKLRRSGRRLSHRLLRRRVMLFGPPPVNALDHVDVDGVVSKVLDHYQAESDERSSPGHGEDMLENRGYGVRTTVCPSDADQYVPVLLDRPVEDLRSQVDFLAHMCADGVRGVQLRSPESWAGEFLDLIRDNDTPQRFFAEAQTSPYAADGAVCRALVQVAAAYAWQLHQENPGYAVPGSLRHTLGQLRQGDRAALARRTADYSVHSYEVEKQFLSPADLQKDLNALFQQQ